MSFLAPKMKPAAIAFACGFMDQRMRLRWASQPHAFFRKLLFSLGQTE